MEKIIKKFLTEYKTKNRKRFDILTLEKYIISHYKGSSQYLNNGGYKELYDQIMMLKNNQSIKEIHASKYNGFTPPLKTRWQIIFKEEQANWNPSKMLQYSDLLEFSYYMNNLSYQTEREWEFIENIYAFLKTKDERQWASIEERSLELFYDEKYLTKSKDNIKGKYGILSRLKLTHEDLKMKKYGEMFIYWNKGVKDIQTIIILENHSTFFTYKRQAERDGKIFGIKADALIFGEGKKIENSFSFLEELVNIENVEIYYFGDIDSEGFGIYYRLKERYPQRKIRLQYDAYAHLISLCDREYPLDGQKKSQLYLDYFIEEMQGYLDHGLREKLLSIWENDFRIPQELINYDVLLKVKS